MKRMLQLAALVLALAAAGQTALALPPPKYCGGSCSPEGAHSGCRCQLASGGYYETICTCVNGRWVDL